MGQGIFFFERLRINSHLVPRVPAPGPGIDKDWETVSTKSLIGMLQNKIGLLVRKVCGVLYH